MAYFAQSRGSKLASRFRIKILHQSCKAEERGYELHASLQCQLFEWNGHERAVEIEPKMTAFQRAAFLLEAKKTFLRFYASVPTLNEFIGYENLTDCLEHKVLKSCSAPFGKALAKIQQD